VASFIEIVTMRPPPCSSISGTTARAMRKQPVTLVSEHVAEAVRWHLPEGLRVRQEMGVDGAHPDARVVDE